MRKLTTAAIGAACLVLGAGGATLYTHAATGPAVYSVYEANVKDEAAYTAALPEVDKLIKEHNGQRVAGGFPLGLEITRGNDQGTNLANSLGTALTSGGANAKGEPARAMR